MDTQILGLPMLSIIKGKESGFSMADGESTWPLLLGSVEKSHAQLRNLSR